MTARARPLLLIAIVCLVLALLLLTGFDTGPLWPGLLLGVSLLLLVYLLLADPGGPSAASGLSAESSASISHEIRTPLTGILGVMHLLRRSELDRNQQRYVDTATNSARMLLAIINELFVTEDSSGDTSWSETEYFSISEVVEDVTSILEPEATSKELEVVCDIDPVIPGRLKGSALRMRQILNNLMNNAIKHTEEGFVLTYAKTRENGIEFGVRDTGSGIEPDKRAQLLRPLEQIESETHHLGTIPGLVFSRRLIEAMQGELQIESTPGEGSRFFFTLPIEGESKLGFDWNPPQAVRGLSIVLLSPLQPRRDSIVQILEYWQIGRAEGVEFDPDLTDDLPDIEPCDVLIIDQNRSEQAVDDLIERLRNHSEWRETRFINLVPQNRKLDRGNADIRLHKPLANSRLYTALLDIVYQQAYNAEYDSARSSATLVPEHDLSGRRILLAEDNEINKMIVLEMLEETGVDVDVATNGVEAVAQVQNEDYDLLLMDIQMPEMDGFAATRAIRALGGRFEHLPIIAMTAHALEGDSGKSLEAGMDFHVSKPFEPDEFIALIARFIDERGSTNDPATDDQSG